MAEKKTAAKPAPKRVAPPKDPQTMTLQAKKGDAMPMIKAKAATRPSLNAALVVNAYQKNILGRDVDLDGLVEEMQAKFKVVNGDDLTAMENMLIGQATALQTMFTSLAVKAAGQEYLKNYQTFMALALKAQAQSRATISALVDLKYPKQAATFVKQANISNGHQQVNNAAIPAQAHASAEVFQTAPNKLLEVEHERLDIGAQATAGRADKRLEAVGQLKRA